MNKALIKVGYGCNNNCVFCHSRPFRNRPELTTAQLRARLRLAKRRGAEMAVFSGGEPTLRADVLAIAAYAASLGLRTGFITNGRRFAYPRFAEELLRRGSLGFVYLSFHSANRVVHEASARTDSLAQVGAALANLTALRVPVTVNTVVTALNIGGLRAVVDALAPFRPAKIKLSAVEPKGAALEDTALLPPLAEAARAITDALEHGRRRYPGQRFGSEGLTPCLLPGFQSLDDDLVTNGFSLFAEAFEKDFSPPDYANRAKPQACLDCSETDRCPGVYAGYLHGPAAFAPRPLARPRANSFVFLRDGDARPLPREPGECGAGAEHRRVLLALGRRAHPYRAPTADFSDAEVARTLSLGQLYLSRDGRHRGLDYARDLVKLEPAPLCRRCERRAACGGMYAPTTAPVFREVEAAVERLVRRLRGAVLDVGCGTVRFRDLIARAARLGRLSYTGIDPELSEAAEAPGLSLSRVGIEDFEAEPESFDHALLMRSYNHLPRLSEALAKLRRLLKPGGSLTVVDGVPFGLVLPRPPAAAAPGERQHYRNHSSGEARRVLEAAGFVSVAERPVRPGGGSEWLLRMRKA